MKIQNIIKGEVVTDPDVLSGVLGLSLNDNCMINTAYDFPEEANKRAEHVGYQLPMVMMAVKMSRLTPQNLTDFIQRLAYTDACGRSAIDLPNGVDDLVELHAKLKGWMESGWEIETDLSHMERPDFVEFTEFKVVQDVTREIRELRNAIKHKLMEQLPEEAAEELE